MKKKYWNEAPAKVRFWTKVNMRGPTQPGMKTQCWEWTGAQTSRGYGNFWVNRKTCLAHRFSYEMAIGPLPKKHHACHKCDNPICIRPDHLFPGTDLDNARDKIAKGRSGLPGKRYRVSKQLAKEIVARCLARVPQKQVAREFEVAVRTVQRCLEAARQTETVE